jgi:hypothetical protein
MTNWSIRENESPENYLEKPEVVVGDTIEILSNNQLGYKKYKVVLKNGNKTLKTLADWGAEIYEGEDDEDDEDEFEEADDVSTQEIYGGKKSKKQKTKKSKKSKKQKTKKSKKSKKQKTKKNRR